MWRKLEPLQPGMSEFFLLLRRRDYVHTNRCSNLDADKNPDGRSDWPLRCSNRHADQSSHRKSLGGTVRTILGPNKGTYAITDSNADGLSTWLLQHTDRKSGRNMVLRLVQTSRRIHQREPRSMPRLAQESHEQ